MEIIELKGFNVHYHVNTVDVIDSTNTYLKEHYNDYPDKTVLYAYNQTNGRGRYKRVWNSNDAVCFSILLKERKSDELIAPLAICLALADFDADAKIKWPNDVYLNGHKLAGILIEDIFMPEYKASVIGMGINLKKKEEFDSCGLEGYNVDPFILMNKILDYYYVLLTKNTKTLVDLYRKYSIVIGKRILHLGKEYIVDGIDDEGHLIVSNNDKVLLISTDEINIKEELMEDVK